MTEKKEIPALIAFNKELREIVESALDQHPEPNSLTQGQALLALGKAYKTHGAIIILCEQGYGEDAAILSRSLFELAIATAYIVKDTTGKVAKRYFEYDWVIRDEMYEYLLTKDELKAELEKRVNALGSQDEKIDEIKKKAQEIRAGYTKEELRKRNWSGKLIKEMAQEVNREDAYKTAYALQCNLAHSAIRVANEYVKEEGEGIMMDISPSENWVPESLVTSIDFFLMVIRVWNDVFNHGLNDKIQDIEKRYTETVAKLNKKT